ncbi:flagellin [uncultured Azohydromonas sp.]|mgnify:CR=1 FL=1|jgi:Flagellin and related hook-associated proteins|uniref:flagellin N-terminal helical domain-containing protein n=1 Tax=uncultured Azohydromonas sp. TaxID=487342 RepID=UPI002604B90D|nr:flagellin [uncultured Azohydromonas sp.]
MAQTLNSNLAALTAQRHISTSQHQTSVAMQRLSSGVRINSAKEDAAGLAIASRMTSQIRGMNAALRNTNDGISLAQVADVGLGKTNDMLQRMRELTIQAANDTNTSSDRAALDKEFGQLAEEVQRVLGGTTFNKMKILGADAKEAPGKTLAFQVGANATDNDSITVNIVDMTKDSGVAAAAGSNSLTPIVPRATLAPENPLYVDTITNIDNAIESISKQRSEMGAAQSRFEAIVSTLQVAVEDQSTARSRIMDADYAAESANLLRTQIMTQAAQAMLAQANQQPQQIMKLLQG